MSDKANTKPPGKSNAGFLDTVLVTGYAPAPRGTSMQEIYKHAGAVLEIELGSHVIVNAEFTMVTELARDFFVRLLQGYDLHHGVDPLVDRIRNRYWAPSTEAVVACVKIAVQRYFDILEQRSVR